MELLHGMLVKLALKRTAGDSDYHTALARIRIDGDKATCRCVVRGCHRLSLSPEITNFLLAAVTAYPDIKNEIITISDGHYDPKDNTDEFRPDATAAAKDLLRRSDVSPLNRALRGMRQKIGARRGN